MSGYTQADMAHQEQEARNVIEGLRKQLDERDEDIKYWMKRAFAAESRLETNPD